VQCEELTTPEAARGRVFTAVGRNEKPQTSKTHRAPERIGPKRIVEEEVLDKGIRG